MLRQEAMIEQGRKLCERDHRVVGTLMYGSFAFGEGDEFSDVEVLRHLGRHRKGPLVVDGALRVSHREAIDCQALLGLVSPLVVKETWMGP